MKKALKKLSLAKETLRTLESGNLENVAGAKPPITITQCLDTGCYPPTTTTG